MIGSVCMNIYEVTLGEGESVLCWICRRVQEIMHGAETTKGIWHIYQAYLAETTKDIWHTTQLQEELSVMESWQEVEACHARALNAKQWAYALGRYDRSSVPAPGLGLDLDHLVGNSGKGCGPVTH
jgi:hypothetical protein